ncbi:Na(+)/H(+) antiporter subunit D [Methanoregula sp.]|uniref:Na(+)/H(+) antiporter subunit D n=1 Tax=Methanoregula sp. TaxID=2052170 RepID=UPI000CBC180F|nr:Na(+)/H(+) antiporter subunit D [Methanoregula sp.]PKG33947.1 MAG: Na(+)/H(+) antiporter subunit D [Methanoregula sp.]
MTDVMIPPALILIAGALLVPFLNGRVRKIYVPAVSLAALGATLLLAPGMVCNLTILHGYTASLLRVDTLSLVVGYIFAFAGLLALIYARDEDRAGHQVASLLQIGSGLGIVFAGDFYTLFVFWELLAVSSVLLIWYGASPESRNAGLRYILLHIFGGGCLLGAIVITVGATGNYLVGPVEPGTSLLLLLLAIGVNAAFIALHVWLPDSYPRSTVPGAVILCIFTTKAAIYLLARTSPGAEGVAYMGGLMVIYGVVFALLQNDVRKLLSYHIVSQVGYMVAAVGIGTALAVNGGIAHLFNHILYKSLLFMCMGAVIAQTGRSNLSELGGLARKMPITLVTCVIAAAAISGIPGFNGFISKGMIISAAAEAHLSVLEIVLIVGSVGTLLSFAKLTYYAFFAKNDGIVAKEAPLPMLVAMVIAAACCILYGLFPGLLYTILPYPVEYHAFGLSHLAESALVMVAAGIILFLAWRLFVPKDKNVPEFMELYRTCGNGFVWFCTGPLARLAVALTSAQDRVIEGLAWFVKNPVVASQILFLTCIEPIARRLLPRVRATAVTKELEAKMEAYPGDHELIQGSGYGLFLVSLLLLVYFLIVFLNY